MAAHPRKQMDQQMKELEAEHQQEWASNSTIKENKPTSFRDVGRRCSMCGSKWCKCHEEGIFCD